MLRTVFSYLGFLRQAPFPAEFHQQYARMAQLRSPVLGANVALGYVHRDFVEPGTAVEVAATSSAMIAAEVSSLPFVPLALRLQANET